MHNKPITPFINGRRYFSPVWQTARPAENAGQDRSCRLCPAYFPLVRKVRGGTARHNIS
jgi:hypothetical protein